MPPAFQAIEEILCKVAEQKWIEDKATGAICSAITKQLPIPDCPRTLDKIWDKVVTMCPQGLAVEAGSLAVSFLDCGDASTDVLVKDVTPKTITAGSTTTITGSGSLKKDISGGSYSMRMTGVLSSVLVKNCDGDASKANTCDIVAPLLGKVGSLAYEPVTFPVKAGDISGIPKVSVTLRAGLPASLEKTTTTLKVTASNGDKLICVQIMTKSATEASMQPALPPVSMPSVPSVTMPPAFQAIEEMVCKVAEQKWIENKATGAICSAITKQLPIPDCPSTLDKIWDKIVTMCPQGLAVEAGSLAVSFQDCGDASTDVLVKDVTPKTITAGSTTTITGSGSLKKDIFGGSYSMRMTGVLSSVLVKNCDGDASKANTCDIVAPLLGKAGSLAYEPVTFPVKAGEVSGIPKVSVTLRAGLPASLEKTTTTLKVTASNGDKLICVQIRTKSAAQSNLIVV